MNRISVTLKTMGSAGYEIIVGTSYVFLHFSPKMFRKTKRKNLIDSIHNKLHLPHNNDNFKVKGCRVCSSADLICQMVKKLKDIKDDINTHLYR